jgi:TolB-like protein/Tfp pilus assembly protein PilF
MLSERWQTCMDVFNAAVEQPPDERAAFLERSCDGDEALRRKIELLLKYHDKSGDFIKSPAFEVAPELLAGDPKTLIGQNLGCYRVDAVAGVGGMGVVYLAWDERLGRKVALKLLPESMVANETELTRLKREARTASALNHPNIVTIHDIGEVGSIHFVAAEFIEGTTLRERMTKGPIPPNEAVDIAAQVASALGVAHRAGIVHRDIKPENIMLRPDGYVKVLDFGIAKLTQQETLATTTVLGTQLPTQQSMMLGTTRYMSPEQAMAQQVDARSDLWSLGVVLYEMLAGRAPFEGETATDVIAAISESDPQPLKHRAPIVPSKLQGVVDRSLRKDPTERYQAAEEMLSELRGIKEKTDGIAARNARWIAVAALAALLAGLALFYAWRGGRTDSAPATAVTEKSIAVLPFENRSGDTANAYFAGGIQDEILTRLSKIADLKVISRTSTQHYKSAPENLPEIAKQLGVAYILEGSVQKSGEALRVNVQLIKAANDSHLWADTFDRKLSDIFSVESEVAKAIADQLRAKLTGQEEQAISAKPTDNIEAYDAYLRGLAYYLKTAVAPANFLSAQKYLGEAVRLDPKFAPAWALLSYVDAGGYLTRTLQPTAALREEARQAAETALALEPNLGEAILAKGYYHYACLKDYETAVRYLEQARQLLPNKSVIPENLAYVTRRRGQWDRSEAYFNEAGRLDPRNVHMLTQHALLYVDLRRFAEALRKFDQVLNIIPDDLDTLVGKAAIAQAEGDLPRAAALLAPLHPAADDPFALETQVYQAILERRPAPMITRLQEVLAKPDPALGYTNGELRFWLGWAQDVGGDHAVARETWQQARSELESFLKEQPENFQLIGDLALTNMGLGDKAGALGLAERAMAAVPIEKDAVDGPWPIEILARVAAQMGEPDRAIAALQKLLSIPYEGPLASLMPLTPALLRLDPMFDPLRNDPRFEKILEESKNSVTLTTILPREKSIAVLPFENLSKGEENAFFAGGVQDEILTDLAKIADLKVISRTSVMKYKSDMERNLREIAKTLGVSHVVEGSVQRAAGRVRVNVQLIDARNDAHIWAEHYDRDFSDIFAIQSEIAERIADQLRAKLSPSEKAAIAERPTADPVAYAFYTQAKAIGDESDWEGADRSLNRKVELLEKATQRDPNFALAYCALAKAQCDLYSVIVAESLSAAHLELAKKAADAALRVRPDLGQAHLELARYYFYAGDHTGDFDRALEELTIARRKLPNDSEALFIAARIDRRQNRWDHALANFQKAKELDPRNTEVAFWCRDTYRDMRRYNEFEQLVTKDAASGLLRDPWTQLWLAEVKFDEGDPVAAQALLEQVPLEFSPIEMIWGIRFKAALYLRDYDAANRVIAAIPAKFADRWLDGLVAVARGNKERAQSIFLDARKRLDAKWGTEVRDALYFSHAAEFDAGLGRKEEAIREARRAVDLKPIAKDSLQGPRLVTSLALVHAWTGERDRALEQLEIVATIPAGPSYGDLRFNPCWDSLRDDKRFDKIIAAAKAASR